MRKKVYYLIIIFSLLHYACERQKQQSILDPYSPKVIEARIYTVPQDSIAPPEVVVVQGVKTKAAGKPRITTLNSNVFSCWYTEDNPGWYT